MLHKIKTLIEKHQYINFVYQLLIIFFQKEGMQRASSLSYTILLSFVPFFISVASITTFLLPSQTYIKLENYLFTNYLPGMEEQVVPYIKSFYAYSGQLSLVSFSFLFITSILMLRSLRHHLTRLCNNSRIKEKIGKTLLINLTIMIVSPVALALGILITSYINSTIKINYSIVLSITSICLSILAFTIVYKFMSLNKVKFSHAFIAGIATGILFEIAKKCFVIYVKYFAVESVLYGAVAAVPIFLLWLYICCLILLLGASILAELERKLANNIVVDAKSKDV